MRELELPELPEGYFWRVRTAEFDGSKPVVELRAYVWFWTMRVYAMRTYYKFDTIKEEVEYLAQSIYYKWIVDTQETNEMNMYLGDYHA